MSYDLAFWEGAPPRSDEEAAGIYQQVMDALEEEGGLPPTPAVEALVRGLETRWPIGPADSPWATFPLGDDASGNALYVNLTFETQESVIDTMASMAHGLGVVSYDPQREIVL
jgi:hypothetical protein